MNRDERGTAEHEAGHALLYLVFGIEPAFATIIPRYGVDGVCFGRVELSELITDGLLGRHFDDRPEKRRAVNIHVMATLAGSLAQDLFQPGRLRDEADERDHHDAFAFADRHAGWAERDRKAYFARLEERATQILVANRALLERIADALQERKTLDREQLKALCPAELIADWDIPYQDLE